MPMDPQLAAIYGTDADESDVEKLAAAELAGELAEDGEEETAELSDEEAEALAQQLLADGEEEDGAKVEEPEEEQEKLSEADYLGRVMAHAYTQELRKIAGIVKKKAKGKKTVKPGFFGRMKGHAGKAWGTAKRGGKRYGELMAGGKGAKGWKQRFRGKPGPGGGAGGVWGARLGTAAAIGAAGYGAKKLYDSRKEKRSSALDTLAEQRALEILAENGIDVNEQEKTSASEQEMYALQNAVEQRAFELLEENGYISEDESDEQAEE